ncbi:MAG: hypothetical protein OK442_00220 [Thaumarchaeota archaeon]|nr:hypothetical protein [Nitrososphaerota archaeon]
MRTLGSCTTSAATAVADVTGGWKAIKATGATSGLHATTEYKVNPWVAFYNSLTGGVSFSFIGTAPTSIVVEAHGLTAGKLVANSITIAGVSTNHAAVTIGTNGEFHTAGAKLVVSPSSNVPFGTASVVIKGATFNYASGNIALASGTWGGVLISSIIGGATTTGVAAVSATSFMPGSTAVSLTSPAPQTSQMGFFGYGFVPSGLGGGVLTMPVPTGAQYSTPLSIKAGNGGVGGPSGVGKPDANGAFFATAVLGDTPWSSASTPIVEASYAQTVFQAATGPANILSPSFSITAWIQSPTPATVDYTTSTEAVTAHGFGGTETLTLTVGGSAMVTGGTCTTSTAGACTTAAGQVPDIDGGSQTVSVAGAVTGLLVSGSVTYDPVVNFASGQTLTVDSGEAGVMTTIRTGDGYGVHGLMANTAYDVVWNAISGSTIVGTFTSTSTGGIPGPGVSFAIPSGPSGIHILDIQTTSGASALYAGQVYDQVAPTEPPFNGTYTTAYGDMLFNEVAATLP